MNYVWILLLTAVCHSLSTQNDSTLNIMLLTIQILLLYMNHCLILASEHDNVHVQAAMLIKYQKHSQIKGKSIAIWKKADFVEVKEDFRQLILLFCVRLLC